MATSAANDQMYRRLVSFFAIPRVALPLSSPALQRLIALVLAGWDVRAYPRLGASAHDLDDPTGWNVWLHDRRMLLSDWLTCFAETPVPSDATPVAPVAPAAPARAVERAEGGFSVREGGDDGLEVCS